MKKIIFFLFAFVLFFIPIVLWPFTSEVFEFNKIVLLYIATSLIVSAWIIKSILDKKIIFRRTILDTPFLIFLGSQAISTLLSIDAYTSFLGYYSRFNGGLLSTICYLLLYWAFVSNFNLKDTFKLIKMLFASAILVSIYGVLEHFGIDKNLWVQDVQSRVFSTLGQPNWLAAWVTALIPVTWSLMLIKNKKDKEFWLYFLISLLYFWTLIFTKSRSGFLGFVIAGAIFWGTIFIKNIKNLKQVITSILFVGVSIVIVCLISGTQWTPSLISIVYPSAIKNPPMAQGTALENGGTESGTIRKIVWKGAIQIWENYPIFGSGLETFAYSYYLFRPIAHNVTSEWDFIYNKAHNEFLNYMANSGTVGIVAYLIVIVFSIVAILKNQQGSKAKDFFDDENWIIKLGLLSGFISLSVSNFFGFSVVPTQLEFFLFPAFAIALANKEELEPRSENASVYQKIGVGIILLFAAYLLFLSYRYWYADILYSKAKAENSIDRPDLAYPILDKAIKLAPGQAIYYAELGTSYSTMAMAYNQIPDATGAAELSNLAIEQIQKAINLAPANINLRRQMFGIFVRLSTIDEKYLITARDSLLQTLKMAPTDAKLYYNLGIADANLGETTKAVADFQKAIELKPNYGDARVQYAALLVHLNRPEEAKTQLNYVLTQIDPGNITAKRALDNIK